MTKTMRKMPACLLAGIIAVAVAFAIGAFAAQEAYADGLGEGTLYVGGQDIVTAENQTVAGGQGTAKLSYDDNGNPVLTLEDFTYKGPGYSDYNGAIRYYNTNNPPVSLTIKLVGDNTVVCTANNGQGIASNRNITITSESDGTLDVKGEQSGIYLVIPATLTISGAAVKAAATGTSTGTSGEHYSYGVQASSLAVNGGSLDAAGGNYRVNYGICAGGDSDSGVVIGSDGIVTATGSYKAIEGKVKNAIPGLGWNNMLGTLPSELGEEIDTNTEGQSLRQEIKKVVFAPPHKHKDAEGNEITFQPWGSTVGLPYEPGNYYLTGDVTLDERYSSYTINLCLNGHSITCQSSDRAAIEVYSITLSLYNCGTAGTITHASGKTGSGVYVDGDGTFNMYGGTISGNSAENGGGVNLQNGTFKMFGGTITGNSASASGGGIFVPEREKIQLSGSPKITGNTVKHKANNIYLGAGAKAKITKKLTTPGGTSGPQIGVNMASPGVFTEDLSGSLVGGTTVKDLFSSDCPAYIITKTDDHEAQLERVVKMNGDGTEDSPYQIKTYADLQEFASIVNGKHQAPQNTAACGKLMNDITCDDKEWVPISDDGTYAGTFDGNHKVIYDLSNEETGAGKNNQGLFGKIVKGEVKNVGIVGGKIIGKYYVGAVVGYNIGTMTNCYNTGSVSGLGYVGGVAGIVVQGPGARATITNCYNTGSVSGSQGVGGLVGYNGSLIAGGTITNCYNVGSVSGSQYVGGVAGSNSGAINNCYYNKELNVVKAIGNGSAGTNVEGLETSQMVGAAALNNMTFSYESPSENPWLTKEAGKDADSGTYYEYYPHLKGFAYDISKKAADWPGKLTTSADWSDDAVSYIYNGSAQGPKVTKVISSPKPVEIPDGMTAEWRKKIVEDVDNPEWGETICDEPSLSGVYKLTIKDPKDGDKVIEEIVYIILKKKNSSNSNDYNVKYQVQKKTAGGGTEWSDIDPENIVEPGKYKAVVQLTSGNVLEEKEFQITPIPLKVTINGSSAKKTYNGKQQTYTGTVTVTSQDKAFDTSKFRYTGSTVVKGTKAGTYTTKLTAKDCAYSDSHYGLQVTVGSPIKLTITENKKPEPKPVVNKAAAKIALDAGVVAKSSGSKVTASWGAVKGASSYVIYANYCDKKKLKKIRTVSGKTTSIDITKLNGKKFNPKKNLKFYVVAYTTVKGKKVKLAKSIMAHAPGSKNSKRTNVTGVKVKKASFTLKKGKTAKIKAKLVLQKKSKKPLKHCAKFRYASSNKKVAKVSKKGKITAVGKGKCTVYVYAVSGVSKKIKVTVR